MREDIHEINGKQYLGPSSYYEEAFVSAGLFTFCFYPQDRIFIPSKQFIEFFGAAEYYENMPDGMLEDFLLPEDKEELIKGINEILEGAKTSVMILHTRDKNIASRITTTVLEYDEEGKPVFALGVSQAIDGELAKEREMNAKLQKLTENQQEYLAISQALSIEYESVYHLDVEKNIVKPIRLSEVIDKLYGEYFRSSPTYEQAFGAYVGRTVYGDDKAMLYEKGGIENLKVELLKDPVFEQEYRVLRDGEIKYFNMKVVRLGKGPVVKSLVFGFADVNDQKRRWENLLKQSRIDELTGLGNRRAYDEEINKLLDEGYKDVSIISLDVNGLKQVNDTLGHAAGDELLIGAAECIKAAFGIDGKCFRMGGDEFSVIIEKKPEDLKIDLNVFEACIRSWRGTVVKEVSISYGIASSSEFKEVGPIALSRIADDNMYKNKVEYYMNLQKERENGRD